MNLTHKRQVVSRSAAQTEAIAEKLGAALRSGEVIELVSDLGGGKTTFVRGLVRGLGSDDRVASPTFTLSKLYQGRNHQIHHFDFYRLPEPGIMANELAEVVGDPQTVVVVEWGDVVQHVLPDNRLTVTIERLPDDDAGRRLIFTTGDDYAYVLDAVSDVSEAK
jgi:tRNA threonylcarbamoyladenosine biosynthesis protein TsaE